MRWYNSNNEECVLQLACNWPVNVCRPQSFNRSGLLSYCSRTTGGAEDSFSTFPGLTSTIFVEFIVKRQKIYLLYLVTPQHSKAPMLFWLIKAFSLTGTQLISGSLMWRSDVTTLDMFVFEEKRNMYTFVLFSKESKDFSLANVFSLFFFWQVYFGHQHFTSYLYLLDATV